MRRPMRLPASATAASCSPTWSGSIGCSAGAEPLTVGDLRPRRLQAYNDTFGHPAGDALLARLGRAARRGCRRRRQRLSDRRRRVRRSTASEADGESTLESAQAALGERGRGFAIGCSRRHARIVSGHHARAGAPRRRPASLRRQALAQVRLGTRGQRRAPASARRARRRRSSHHLGHVAALAEPTAALCLGLPAEEVELTRLAAELHDVGKAAIPESILNKPGALDAQERQFMERHSAIGERIVEASPALEAKSRRSCARRTSAPTEAAIPTACGSSRSRSAPASSPSSTPSTP